jgi:hypothetical protein
MQMILMERFHLTAHCLYFMAHQTHPMFLRSATSVMMVMLMNVRAQTINQSFFWLSLPLDHPVLHQCISSEVYFRTSYDHFWYFHVCASSIATVIEIGARGKPMTTGTCVDEQSPH